MYYVIEYASNRIFAFRKLAQAEAFMKRLASYGQDSDWWGW